MYAVVRSGGKQLKVKEGDVIRVELLDAKDGDKVRLEQVLLLGEGDQLTIGRPLVKGAAVTATVRGTVRGEKVRIVKKRRRKHYKKVQGHRQSYTELAITGISK
ncbi:MAG: 50S ribosomal protein L21 [Gammaproteobacteria bacterium]|nr:50S ribosomal protein L21 [Gammaproteobacteria bacterium]